MPNADLEPSISFDEDCRVRVLDTEKFKRTEDLAHESIQFVEKITEFSNIVHQVADILEAQSNKIELEKLRAIGERNRVDGELENRARQQMAIRALLNEKEMELERYKNQYRSLQRAEAEQRALIDKLSNNEI